MVKIVEYKHKISGNLCSCSGSEDAVFTDWGRNYGREEE